MLNSAFYLRFFIHLFQIYKNENTCFCNICTIGYRANILQYYFSYENTKIKRFFKRRTGNNCNKRFYYHLPASVYVTRSKEPLEIVYQSENKRIDTLLKAEKGPLFYLANIPSIPAFGVGYWV